MYKHLYTRFLDSDPERLHFAAHSHHPWPDVTRDAHIRYWDDAARHIDDKWTLILDQVIPAAQEHIASILHLSTPRQIAFAQNTHEFVARLLSCFEPGKPLSILTTDGEFHSFQRQCRRLQELPYVSVQTVPVEPFSSFEERFSEAASCRSFDLIFVSQVFFNSGFAIADLTRFVGGLGDSHKVVVIDGYHAFCALPTDLSAIEQQVFYLAGGYKYAQAGEGACFMHIPRGCSLRPLNTGWFAAYRSLNVPLNDITVRYRDDGYRFWGSTCDPSGIYRLNAALGMLSDHGLTIGAIHDYVQRLQQVFLVDLEKMRHPDLNSAALLKLPSRPHGHFLAYKTKNAKQLCETLHSKKIITDYRGDTLRIGFGIYHDHGDVRAFLARIQSSKINPSHNVMI